MNQEEKRELKPKLRFSEFIDDWRIAKIGDFVESYKGGAPLTPSDFLPYSNYEVIPKKAISEGMWLKIDVEKPTYCKESFYKENLQSVVDNTYLITTLRDLVPSGPSIGYVVKYASKKNYILAQGVYGLKPNKTIIPDFLIHFSNTGKYRKMMQSVMVGSTQVHIRNGVYLDLSISVPILEEQQNIADCLSSIGDRITAETQKLDTLKAHKKGLMQQLFPAESETLPKLRFPEFQDAGEWEEDDLSKLSSCGLSNGVFNDPKKVGRGYKLINVLDMYIDTAINEDNLSLVELSREEFLKNKVENGDLFFTRSSLVKSGIAYSNIYLGNSSDITFDGHLIRFRPNKEILIPTFINYLLRTNKVRSQLVARGKTATMTTIGQADVGNVKLSFPHIDEQQKIVDCLSSIDDRITAQIQKIDTLKTHKKGLMQQLFPSVEEVKA